MPGHTRLGDCCTGHDSCPPRPLVTASPNVIINGKGAARVQMDLYDYHGCEHHSPHTGVISSGSPNVFVNGCASGRIGDPVSCGGNVRDGSSNVIVN